MPGRVFVVGSINADVTVTVPSIPTPSETVMGSDLSVLAGGKGANQAVAASRAGAETTLIGCVGTDEWASAVMGVLESTAIDLDEVRRADTTTGLAVVAVAPDGENSIIVVPGANGTLGTTEVAAALKAAGPGDVVVAQLEVPVATVRAALAAARERGATTVLNPSPLVDEVQSVLDMADIVVANEVEADRLGLHPSNGHALVRTRGDRGSEVCVDDRMHAIDARRTDAVDSTGAGDCFLGVLAAGLAGGEELLDASRVASVAASLQVERPGAAAAMPTAAEIAAAITT